MLSPYIRSDHFRLRDDDGDETGATWFFATDVQAPDPIAPGTRFRMRMALAEQNDEVAKKSSFIVIARVNGGAWLTNQDLPNVPFDGFDSIHITTGLNPTTQQITSGLFTPGYLRDLNSQQDDITIEASSSTEFELALELQASQYGISYTEGDIIDVSLAYADYTLLDEYLVLPTFTAAKLAGFSNLYIGGIQQTDIRVGGTLIQSAYLGSQQLYQRG